LDQVKKVGIGSAWG